MITINALNYNVYISKHSYSHILERELSISKYSSLFILVDENTRKNCVNKFVYKSKLSDFRIIEIPAGEEYKNMSTLKILYDGFLKGNIDRNSLVINLGGGVLSDIGGFAASTILRGIDFINIPTTLLSIADASIGGKLGFDYNSLKNYIGIFNTPKAIIVDFDYLETLEKRELYSGFAEIVKHALIFDEKYFSLLEKLSLGSFLETVTNFVPKSIEIKNEIVKTDYKEASFRKILNFGHTIGHAIESFYLHSESKLLHGEAIWVGMICELYLSKRYFNFNDTDIEKVISVYKRFYKKIRIKEEDMETILSFMHYDKKNSKGNINFVLLENIGIPKIDFNPEKHEIINSFKFYNNET